MSDHGEIKYEKTDADPQLNFYIFSGVTVFCAVMILLMIPFSKGLEKNVVGENPKAIQTVGTPSVQLETKQSADYETHKEQSEKEAAEFAWVDKSKGIVSVPVNKAIEMTLKKKS